MTEHTTGTEDHFDRLLEARMTRRKLLERFFAATAVGVGLSAMEGFAGQTVSEAAPVSASMHPVDGLAVEVFPTSLKNTQDLLKTYQQQYGVSASVMTVPSDYYTVTETRFLSGKPPFDALDMDPGFMGKYWANKWVTDLEGLPGVDKLKKDMFPAARKACTAPNGKLAALPYYTNIVSLFYNQRILKKFNLKPATTWDEMVAQAKKMKKGGLASPIVPVWTTRFDLTSAMFIAECISRGMHSQFDKNLNPLWDKNKIALQVLNFWATIRDQKLVPVDALTIDHHQDSSIMQAGEGAYFWFNSYELANLNKVGTSKEAGNIRAALMPNTHYTSTFTAVTYQSKRHAREQAWPLTSFVSGYDKNGHLTGPIQRVGVGDGSLVGYKSALKSAAIKKAWSAWASKSDLSVFSKQLAHAVGEGAVLNTTWYSDYSDFMTKTLSRFLNGEISAQDALKTTADHARSIKK